MPLIPIPDARAAYKGTATTVTVALLAVAQCPNGHNIIYTVPDVEDLGHYTGKTATWADEHADKCPGPSAAVTAEARRA
ncbi:hypothetical protein [Streptomyces sp. NPDC059786]|uniref:hypothetical protein n=1 Tax=Streptomyces sp. NPDC059786 TaxID=3346946 RepID=UPI00365345C8